ncbi:leukocyte immunoglobulin-like receptor subfamily A member 2 [Phascolarctos cinereus]
MTHTLSVLLCLGLCLGQRMKAEADTLPRPSLKAENGPLVPLGTSVTLRCRGGWEGDEYRLEKWEEYGRKRTVDVKSNEMEGEFHIPSLTAKDAGTYYCFYKHSSHWSDRSDPLQLVVTGLYDPPSLSALPSSQVASGHNVTLQCQSEDGNDRFALYKDGEQITQGRAQPHGRGSLANFSIPAVSAIHGRTYQCYIFHSYRPYEWSAPSNPLVLRVTGTFSPNPESGNTQFDSAPQDYTVGNLIRLSLAGMVLLLLGVLLVDARHSLRGPLSRNSRYPWTLRDPEQSRPWSHPQPHTLPDLPLGTIMTPILSALVSLGLCLGQRMKAEADTLPRPSLKAENGPLVPLGTSVTLRCRGGWEGDEYRLEKQEEYGRKRTVDVKSNEMEGEFHIPSVTAKDAGTYYCLYKHSSHWSDHSDPLQLVVTGPYEAPSLSALPSSTVASGHNVTFLCQSQRWYDRSALYKDGEQITQGRAQYHLRGSLANFSIPAVYSTHRGTYRCYTFYSYLPYLWSVPSSPLVLWVTVPGTSKDAHLPKNPGNPQALTSTPPRTFSPSPESGNTQFNAAPLDYTTGNVVRLILAGLVLIILGVLMTEAWHSLGGHQGAAQGALA